MKILLRWPHCNADYPGPQPRPVVLDTNVVLDLLIFDDPLVPPIRQLLAQGQLRWITDEAQRIELGRVLSYSKVAPRVGLLRQNSRQACWPLSMPPVQCVPDRAQGALYLHRPGRPALSSIWPAQRQALLVSKDKAVLEAASALWPLTMRPQSGN